MVSQHGYILRLVSDALPAGPAAPVAFRVEGTNGDPLVRYEESHDEDLHLIAVRRHLTGIQHVHPELAADGTWSIPLVLTPDAWLVFADFVPAGHDEAMILGADLAVAGGYDPQPLPEPATTAEVEGYTVTLEGQLVAGEESELTMPAIGAACRSPTCGPTSPPTATSWPCATATWPTCTPTPPVSPVTERRHRGLASRSTPPHLRWVSPTVPRLQARRCRADGRTPHAPTAPPPRRPA